jgi:hypothetical protein
MAHYKKRIGKSMGGAVEGLPLQLLIMVIVASIVIVILLAWLAPWQSKVDLGTIESSQASVPNNADTTITITAWDTKSNTMSGVTIELSGCNVGNGTGLVGTTGSNGTCTFTVHPSVPQGGTNHILVEATYTGVTPVTLTKQIVVS